MNQIQQGKKTLHSVKDIAELTDDRGGRFTMF